MAAKYLSKPAMSRTSLEYRCTCELDLSLCRDLPVLLTRVVERHMEDLSHISSVYPQLESDLTSHMIAGDLLQCIWPMANRQIDAQPANLRLARDCNVQYAIGFSISDDVAVVGGGLMPRVSKAAALLHALLVITSRNFVLPPQLEERVRVLGLPAHRPSRPPGLNPDAIVIPEPMTHPLFAYPPHDTLAQLADHALDLHCISPAQALVQLGVELPWIECYRDRRGSGGPWLLTAQTAAYKFTYVSDRIMDARNGVLRYVLYLATEGKVRSIWGEVVSGRRRPWPVADIKRIPFAKKPANPDPAVHFSFFTCAYATDGGRDERLHGSASPRPPSPSSATASASSSGGWA